MSYRPSAVKSIQRGTITCTNGAAGTTDTLSTAVNTSYSVVRWVGSRATTSGANDASRWNARVVLTNSTTVTAYAGHADCVVSYEVIEYYTWAVKTIQVKSIALNSGNTTSTLTTAVDVDKTILVYGGLRTAVTDAVSAVFPTVELTNSTTITVTVASGSATDTTLSVTAVEFR